MKTNINFELLESESKLFGSLYYKPSSNCELLSEVISTLNELNIIDEECTRSFSALTQDELDEELLYLFDGCGSMPAPPWSSVYLDKEKVLFGTSTIEYRHFLRAVGVEVDTDIREPEDQFGLMLFLLSYLSKNKNIDAIIELLQSHLFTWCFYYLELVNKHANTYFYRSLSLSTKYWLDGLKEELNIKTDNRKIYYRDDELPTKKQ